MKFEYDGKADGSKCVAFIDLDGDLWVKTDEGSVVFYKEGYATSYGDMWLVENATHKFYPGDKITITF